MYRHIFGIGNARYHFNRNALHAFIAEAKERAINDGFVDEGAVSAAQAGVDSAYEARLRRHFDDVMDLYRVYVTTESVDVLVSLKTRLEEVSVTYRSHALAEEVLSINSCLPYERRLSSLLS